MSGIMTPTGQSFSDGKAIGLALSGGGIRAMAFHMGVLRWLAETGRMEQIAHISSVSGGTLIAGLILSKCGWQWPGSQAFPKEVAPAIRQILVETDLARHALQLAFRPTNWRYALSRANVFAQAIEQCWNVHGSLADMPLSPVWSINGTTAETGRRFRFKAGQFGDYELGYADARHFKMAEALAVSAAFPGLIGPLAVRADAFEWRKRSSWGASEDSAKTVTLPYKRIHLYDGGLYDNLGLEPLIDIGNDGFKNDIQYLICSDAGAPLSRGESRKPLHPFRALRLIEIVMDQARALRIRRLMGFLQGNPRAGVYAQIGAVPAERLAQFGSMPAIEQYGLLDYDWLKGSDIQSALLHPTTLRPLTLEQYDRLERHGYESIRWTETLFNGSDAMTASQ